MPPCRHPRRARRLPASHRAPRERSPTRDCRFPSAADRPCRRKLGARPPRRWGTSRADNRPPPPHPQQRSCAASACVESRPRMAWRIAWWIAGGALLDSGRSQRDKAIAYRPPSSSGLGHHPFKVAARVRIPLGVRRESVIHIWSRGEVWSSRRPVKPEVAGSSPVGTAAGGHSSSQDGGWLFCRNNGCRMPGSTSTRSSRRTRHQHGRVAQLAEHTPEKRGVTGSTPVSTTSGRARRPSRPAPLMRCCRVDLDQADATGSARSAPRSISLWRSAT